MFGPTSNLAPRNGRALSEREDPEGLDGILLGPAQGSYSSKYVPFKWRGWWDYGTGALGDMACHIMDMPYWALDLKYPLSVEAEQGGIRVSGPRVVGHQIPVSRRGSNLLCHDLVRRKEGRSSEHAPRDAADGQDLRGYESFWSVTREPWFSTAFHKWKIIGVTPMK